MTLPRVKICYYLVHDLSSSSSVLPVPPNCQYVCPSFSPLSIAITVAVTNDRSGRHPAIAVFFSCHRNQCFNLRSICHQISTLTRIDYTLIISIRQIHPYSLVTFTTAVILRTLSASPHQLHPLHRRCPSFHCRPFLQFQTGVPFLVSPKTKKSIATHMPPKSHIRKEIGRSHPSSTL